MATSTSIKGRRPVQWKKAKTPSNLIFVHVKKSSIMTAAVKHASRTVQNAESSFIRHLCNVADDARPVESRSADQNDILIAVVARELHGDKRTFSVLGAQIHLPTPALQRSDKDWGHAAAPESDIGTIISVRSGSERPVVEM